MIDIPDGVDDDADDLHSADNLYEVTINSLDT